MPDSDPTRIDGLRALVERLEVRVHLHLDLGLAVVGQLDRGDLADRLAADLHLVAVDELAGGLEGRLDGVLVAPRQHQEPDEDRCGHDAADGGYSRGSQTGRVWIRVVKRLRSGAPPLYPSIPDRSGNRATPPDAAARR